MRITLTCKKFPDKPLLDLDIWTLVLKYIMHGTPLGPSFLLEDLQLHIIQTADEVENAGTKMEIQQPPNWFMED